MRTILEPDWSQIIGRRARTYRNLQTGRMTILTRQLNSKGNMNWLLAGHTTSLLMEDVKFHVYENGRQRVIERKRKNVHAWAEGSVVAAYAEAVETPINVAYNPYQANTFVKRDTKIPIRSAKYLAVRSNLVFCSADAIATDWTILSSADAIFRPNYSSFNLIAA